MGLLKENKLYNTVMPDHYITTPQIVTTTTTRDDEIRIRKDCIWQLFVDKKTYTLPDGNNAQEVCTNSSCKCMTKGEQGNFFNPDVADTGGRGELREECEVGGKPRPGWENYNPNSDEPGTDLPKDWTHEDLNHWRCQNQLESEGWPKGTKFKRWQWQQNRRMCTCYVACKDELGNDDPDGRMCMCEPNPSEVDENGEYYTNCTLDTSIPLDHPGMVGSEMNTDPNEGAVNESEEPVTEQELRDSYFSHMHAWAASPPCQGCEMFGAYTWDPEKDGELKWNRLESLSFVQEPAAEKRPDLNLRAPTERMIRISDREEKAFYQSSRNLSVTGGWVPAGEDETVPSTHTTTTTTTEQQNSCCIIVNVNQYMFNLTPHKDTSDRWSVKWSFEGVNGNRAQKICLNEEEMIRGREIKVDPGRMENRPNPPIAEGDHEGEPTIRWKPEKFTVFCEEGEYPTSPHGGLSPPAYQFHCNADGKRLYMMKAVWKPCAEPCLADVDKCECVTQSVKRISGEIDLSMILDDFDFLPCVDAIAQLFGETSTDNFLEQVTEAINRLGLPRTGCDCKDAPPGKITPPFSPKDDFLDAVIPGLCEAVRELTSGIGQIEEAVRFVRGIDEPPLDPNSQSHMCSG